MKTKQDQINEMVLAVPQTIVAYDANPKGQHLYGEQRQQIAETLYDAGYRKTPDDIRELIDVLAEGANLKEKLDEIKRLKSENKQLKTECALLDDELRIARQDTIDVLNKVKDYVNQLACDEYGDSACDTNYVTIDIDKYEQDIDEMIEELIKCRR